MNDPFSDIVCNNPASSEASPSRPGAGSEQCQSAEASTSRRNKDCETPRETGSSSQSAEYPSEGQDHVSTQGHNEHNGLHSPQTVTAAHRGVVRRDRPVPRNMRDPGHGTATSAISVAIDNDGMLEALENSRADGIMQPGGDVGARINEAHEASTGASTTSEGFTGNSDEHRGTPIIIAHSRHKQRLLDNKGVAKGVQFEIARGITHGWWTWDDITDSVADQLRGSNFEKAGKVAQIVNKEPGERTAPGTDLITQAI